MLAHTLNGAYALVRIDTTGRIIYFGARTPGTSDTSFVSLEGISYQPGAVFDRLNPFNSSDRRSCGGNHDPGWVEASAGIVHLEGCALQTSTTSPERARTRT